MAEEATGVSPHACIVLAAIGPAWLEATWPSPVHDHLRFRYVVPTAATVQGVADELGAAARAEGAPVLLFGHSMNGTLALAAAATHPEVVRGVIAVAAPPVLPPDRAASRQWWDTTASDERRRVAKTSHDRALRWHDLNFDPAPIDALAEGDPAWPAAIFGDAANVDWPSILGQVRCPVLLTLGRSDFLVPPPTWSDPPAGFHVEVFGESGHTPFYEEQDRFVDVVKTWLDTEPRLTPGS